MFDKLMQAYIDTFNEDITLSLFLDLEKDEQIKILKQCLEQNIRIYENDYFNEKYMEENI